MVIRLTGTCSLLPIEEDGRLHDPDLKENFIEAMFVLKRWRESLSRNPTRRRFVCAFEADLKHLQPEMEHVNRSVTGHKRLCQVQVGRDS
jgi:hypothetical protein